MIIFSGTGAALGASEHEVLFMANGEIEAGEGQIFSSVGNNTPPDSGVTGAHGLVYDQAAVSKSISFTATQTFSHHVRYYFRVDSDNRDFLLVQDGGATTHLTLTWRTGGVVEVKRSATVLGTVTGLTLSLNTWYEVNFYGLIDDTTGEWTLEIDGVIPNRNEGGTMQQTGVDTRNGGGAAQTSSVGYGEPNLDTYMDDVVVSATNASLGTGQVETLMPSADGFYTALTPNAGTNHFDRVNEKPLSESTFVTSSGASQRDSYAFEDRSISGSIVAVALFWRGRLDAGTPTITPFFRIAGVDFDGTAQATTSSFTYYREVFDNNPATGFVWEDAEINALEAGPLCSSATARIAQFAMQVYVRTS